MTPAQAAAVAVTATTTQARAAVARLTKEDSMDGSAGTALRTGEDPGHTGVPGKADRPGESLPPTNQRASTQPCPHCRTTITHSDTTGCCSGCGQVFVGLSMFDRHQRVVDGRIVCLDPAALVTKKGQPVMERVQRPGGMAWRRYQPDRINPWSDHQEAS